MAALVFAGLGSTGCQKKGIELTERAVPVPTDDAMKYRAWPASVSYFANGDAQTYYSRFPFEYEAAYTSNAFSAYILDVAGFVYQSFRLPFTFIAHPPGSKGIYTAVQYEPSYTAVPTFFQGGGVSTGDTAGTAGANGTAAGTGTGTPGSAEVGLPGSGTGTSESPGIGTGTPGVGLPYAVPGTPGVGAPGSVTPSPGTPSSGTPGTGRPGGTGTGTGAGGRGTGGAGGTGAGGTGAGGR